MLLHIITNDELIKKKKKNIVKSHLIKYTIIGYPSLFLKKLFHLLYSRQRLEIRQSTLYYAGLLGRWDKRIVDQAFGVPSIILFQKILQNSIQKSV